MDNKAKMEKVRSKRAKNPISEEEKGIALIWYTLYDGNYNRTAKKVSEVTGIPRTRKVIYELAKRENFDVLANIVRDEVNKQYYGSDKPGMGRILKIVADVLEIEEDLMRQAKRYAQGLGSSKIRNISELLSILKHVTSDLENISGEGNIKDSAFKKLAHEQGPAIAMTLEQITKNMSAEEKDSLLTDIIDQQTAKILEFHGEETKNTKKKKKKEEKSINQAANMYSKAKLNSKEHREHSSRRG